MNKILFERKGAKAKRYREPTAEPPYIFFNAKTQRRKDAKRYRDPTSYQINLYYKEGV